MPGAYIVLLDATIVAVLKGVLNITAFEGEGLGIGVAVCVYLLLPHDFPLGSPLSSVLQVVLEDLRSPLYYPWDAALLPIIDKLTRVL